MPSLGFENTFALVIRSEDAEKLNIKNLSEAAPYASRKFYRRFNFCL
jgi:glycine betaine/choline ABC-type transport system substrate-binding protein